MLLWFTLALGTFSSPLGSIPVTDPGFPVGGAPTSWGAPTPEAAMLQKICMSKQKNLDPWGARTGGTPWIRHCIHSEALRLRSRFFPVMFNVG